MAESIPAGRVTARQFEPNRRQSLRLRHAAGLRRRGLDFLLSRSIASSATSDNERFVSSANWTYFAFVSGRTGNLKSPGFGSIRNDIVLDSTGWKVMRQDNKYYVVLDTPYPAAEPFGTTRFMPRKIQAKFYVDDDLWMAAQSVFDALGHKYSEGLSRLIVDFLQAVKSKPRLPPPLNEPSHPHLVRLRDDNAACRGAGGALHNNTDLHKN